MTAQTSTSILSGRTIVGSWDPQTQTVAQLRDLLNEIDARPEQQGCEINLGELPTIEFPEAVNLYPVWAVDHQGNALVGPDARDIEPIAKVLEGYGLGKVTATAAIDLNSTGPESEDGSDSFWVDGTAVFSVTGKTGQVVTLKAATGCHVERDGSLTTVAGDWSLDTGTIEELNGNLTAEVLTQILGAGYNEADVDNLRDTLRKTVRYAVYDGEVVVSVDPWAERQAKYSARYKADIEGLAEGIDTHYDSDNAPESVDDVEEAVTDFYRKGQFPKELAALAQSGYVTLEQAQDDVIEEAVAVAVRRFRDAEAEEDAA